MDIEVLTNGFQKLVKDINTRNLKWRDHIGAIDWQIRAYLDKEVFNNNIIQYKLEVKKIGQSIISCDIEYLEKYYEELKMISLKEKVKNPSEVCSSIIEILEINLK
jgi:hypothetical protein